jgi:hypothetical protein
MRKTSGIIINDDTFINSSHVVKMEKSKVSNGEHVINIYLSVDTSASPIKLTFESEQECNESFKKIILEMYSYNYAIVNVNTKTK